MPVGEFEYAKALIPVYLSLHEQAQAMLKRFNPCSVCDGVCERFRRGQGKNFCCEGCVYLGINGCQVKALQCALWVCRHDLIHENNRKAFNNQMWGIFTDADKLHLLVPRGSMEDSIAQATAYYTNHRDERAKLMARANSYKPRPNFYLAGKERPRSLAGTLRSFVYPKEVAPACKVPKGVEELLKSTIPAEENALKKIREPECLSE